jgi:hypothetical protein
VGEIMSCLNSANGKVRCDAIYPEGSCKEEGRVEILSRDFYTTGMKVVVMFCFDCANDAISSGIFEPVIDVEGESCEEEH